MAEFRHPRNWKEGSLDLKLMFAYHVSMMAMMLGGSFSILQEAAVAGTITSLIVLISRSNRQKKHWRWPGVKRFDVACAVGRVLLVSAFLYSVIPRLPPNNSHSVPWYLGGIALSLFGVLQSLKVVYLSEAEFASNCMIMDQYGRPTLD
jgi:hypothetical protein